MIGIGCYGGFNEAERLQDAQTASVKKHQSEEKL